MKTTLKKITEGQPALNLLLEAKLPIKAAYAVSKLSKACASELEHFHEMRKKKFEAAGCTVDEKENKWVHAEGQAKVVEVTKEIEELMSVEAEINALPLDLEQFGNGEVQGASFFGLEWAMKE